MTYIEPQCARMAPAGNLCVGDEIVILYRPPFQINTRPYTAKIESVVLDPAGAIKFGLYMHEHGLKEEMIKHRSCMFDLTPLGSLLYSYRLNRMGALYARQRKVSRR